LWIIAKFSLLRWRDYREYYAIEWWAGRLEMEIILGYAACPI